MKFRIRKKNLGSEMKKVCKKSSPNKMFEEEAIEMLDIEIEDLLGGIQTGVFQKGEFTKGTVKKCNNEIFFGVLKHCLKDGVILQKIRFKHYLNLHDNAIVIFSKVIYLLSTQNAWYCICNKINTVIPQMKEIPWCIKMKIKYIDMEIFIVKKSFEYVASIYK